MKNFGIGDLRLVRPVPFLNDEAYTWACDAKDLLHEAKVCTSLDEALGDLALAAAFTRRHGRGRKRHATLAEAAGAIAQRASDGGAALVFGREDAGLTNDELARCDISVGIPTSEEFPSINLAQSAMLACYELCRTASDPAEGTAAQESFIPREEVADIMARMGSALAALGYEDAPDRPIFTHIMGQWEKIFGRAGLSKRDASMLEGLLARISGAAGRRP
jgi:tRNA/rRNA methyltransferase